MKYIIAFFIGFVVCLYREKIISFFKSLLEKIREWYKSKKNPDEVAEDDKE
jgi:hypothetical protein